MESPSKAFDDLELDDLAIADDVVEEEPGEEAPVRTAYDSLVTGNSHRRSVFLPATSPLAAAAPKLGRRRRGAFGRQKDNDDATERQQETMEDTNKFILESIETTVEEVEVKDSLWSSQVSSSSGSDDDEEGSKADEDEASADSVTNKPETRRPEDAPQDKSAEETKEEEGVEVTASRESDDEASLAETVDETEKDSSKSDAEEEEATPVDNEKKSTEDTLQDPFEPKASSTETSTEMENNSPAEEEPKTLDEKSLLASTDALFAQATDKATVTVKDIYQSLAAEYGVKKLDKPLKAAVRSRLVHLMTERQQQEEEEQSDAEESMVGDADESESEEEAVDDKDEEFTPLKPKQTKKGRKKKTQRNAKSSSAAKRPKRDSALKKKAKAIRIHAEQLRKRRLEELRVRNEELQLHKNQQDQERAERIAAKFETNTEELRMQRLEHRLDLLQKLDQKRISCVSVPKIDKEEPIKPEEPAAGESDDSSDDDDEMELEIVGGKGKLMNKPTALSILDLADRAPLLKQSMDVPKKRKPAASPGKVRAALRHRLKDKQLRMGNQWLARELGYQNPEEHLADCRRAEQRKLALIRKREEERIKANERALLRERMLLAEANGGDDPVDENEEGDEEYRPEGEEEEDEEMAMAKQIEEEETGGNEEMQPVNDAPPPEAEESPTQPDAEAPQLDDQVQASTGENTSSEEESQQLELETQTPVTADLPDNVEAEKDEKTADDADSFPLHDSLPFEFETQPPIASAVSNDSTENRTAEAPSKVEAAKPTDEETEKPEDTVGEEKKNEERELDGEKADSVADEKDVPSKPKGPRNAGWKAMLEKEAKMLKQKKKSGLVEEEADEEEEEEIAGLEDFGFSVHKKKENDDSEEDVEVDDDDLKDVVDDVSDDEGDEDAGEKARKELERKEEKERHKEIMRRMREGYDGRRGGIAAGGARGVHRFDELVAADNREDAKRLGLLNDDELDSDDEGGENKDDDDEEEDEAALLDKMLKDRFLHRSSVDLEENFSDDEEDKDGEEKENEGNGSKEDEDEQEQERLAKRFAKRARMQRLIEAHGDEEEFTQSKLIDEDETIKLELQSMKNGLTRKRSVSRSSSSSLPPTSDAYPAKRQKTAAGTSFASGFLNNGGSLALALKASRANKPRTSFLRASSHGSGGSTSEASSCFQKTIAFNHVVFHSNNSQSQLSRSNHLSNRASGQPMGPQKSSMARRNNSSLWSKAVVTGFQKRR